MIQAYCINGDNIDRLALIYPEFSTCAQEKYRWELSAIDYESLKSALKNKFIKGYLVEDTAEPEPIGFMLYSIESHRAIEINLIYAREGVERKAFLAALMREFTEEIRHQESWDVVSYAMLGEQEHFIRTITWYGFKPVGQAIVRFDVMDPLSIQILYQQQPPTVSEGYRLDKWKPEYAGGVAETLHEAFCNAPDANWDPRFRSLLGTKRVVASITAGEMGKHLALCTTVLLKDETPVGVCFLVQSDVMKGNIPLVGIRPTEKGLGFGNKLLKSTLDSCLKGILDGDLGIFEVNATMETDNIAALKMYRRMGFKEDYNYPHVYLTQEALQRVKIGQWCQ